MSSVSQTQTAPRWRTYALYVVMALLALAFLGSGGTKLAGAEMNVTNFARWGYPLWFMYLTGLIEVVCAILLWPRQTRLIGALGLVATMVGAILTHLVNQEATMIGLPLVLLVLAGIVAWSSRPRTA
ncbi:MAG TPA: DoxX family protein [Herpetosiphonaceae bacterium]